MFDLFSFIDNQFFSHHDMNDYNHNDQFDFSHQQDLSHLYDSNHVQGMSHIQDASSHYDGTAHYTDVNHYADAGHYADASHYSDAHHYDANYTGSGHHVGDANQVTDIYHNADAHHTADANHYSDAAHQHINDNSHAYDTAHQHVNDGSHTYDAAHQHINDSSHTYDAAHINNAGHDYGASHNGHANLGDRIVGNPDAEANYWYVQHGDYSCAVASQKEIIESLTHHQVSEEALAQYAQSHGWFDPSSGTSPDDIGKLLEAYHIPIEKGYNHSTTDIYNALQHGDKVIVGLNANEIWHRQEDANGNPVQQPVEGHAVEVTGLYQDNSGHWSVIMNDTGTPNGKEETVPLADFMNAWSDFSNFAVITNLHGAESHTATQSADAGSHLNAAAFHNSLGGYYNADGTYHWTSTNTDTDPETGKVIRQY